MIRPRHLPIALVGVLAATTLVACGSSTPSRPPSPPPAAPKVGTCRVLSFTAAAGISDNSPVVRCTAAHTAITVSVGTLTPTPGQAANLNSASVQHRLAVSCPKAVRAYTGATGDTFDLSLVQALWFIPTPAQISQGATWYRCDLVVLAGPKKLATVTTTLHNALQSPTALDRWGVCAPAAPSSATFQRTLCSSSHRWRAVSTIPIPAGTAYLASSMSAAGSKKCRKEAEAAAHGALTYTWSFEWPNRQQWEAGQRHGLCWLPRSN